MSDFDFSSILGPVIKAGGGIIGTALGTLIPIPGVGSAIGGTIGAEAANILAQALGVDPTPSAIGGAIETKSPAEVAAAMQEANAAAAAKWPAMAQIALAHADVAKAQIAATQDRMKAELDAAGTMPEGFARTLTLFLQSIWRPLYAIEGLVECMGFSFILGYALYSVIFKNDGADMVALTTLIPALFPLMSIYLGGRFGLLGYYMKLRTDEKTSVVEANTPIAGPAGIDINGLVNGLIRVVASR